VQCDAARTRLRNCSGVSVGGSRSLPRRCCAGGRRRLRQQDKLTPTTMTRSVQMRSSDLHVRQHFSGCLVVRITAEQVRPCSSARDVPVKRGATLRPEAVREIAESMLEIGQETPIVVRRDGDRFVLVDGLHRLEACKALGEETIVGLRPMPQPTQRTRFRSPATDHRARDSRCHSPRRVELIGATTRSIELLFLGA
jgi:uncharacterized ParB-like nuclease family protein